MALPAAFHSLFRRRRLMRTAAMVCTAALAAGALFGAVPALAQQRLIVDFPPRPKPTVQPGQGLVQSAKRKDSTEQMLVRADEINYDYTNERVSAVGNVQIYYSGATLESDRVIYDQKTKRVHAEGSVRLTEADGKITLGEIIDLSDDFRDGFVDSLRLETADETRVAANRAERIERKFHRLPERRLHRLRALQGRSQEAPQMAGQGRPDHPRSGREDDVFRGRQARVFRRPSCLHALLLDARSDRQAQDRLPDALHGVEFDLRVCGHHALLLGALAQL